MLYQTMRQLTEMLKAMKRNNIKRIKRLRISLEASKPITFFPIIAQVIQDSLKEFATNRIEKEGCQHRTCKGLDHASEHL